MVGWVRKANVPERSTASLGNQIDAAVPVYLDIVGVDGELLIVSGDVSALVTAEETEFCIIHPVGVNPQNGATQTNPCQPESRYLWGGGYYLPPIVGFEMDHEGVYGIHGAQPGQNKSGQHYMWNRRYDIHMGRWTSPDPAMTPWGNLADFINGNPLTLSDPSGLRLLVAAEIANDVRDALIQICPHNGGAGYSRDAVTGEISMGEYFCKGRTHTVIESSYVDWCGSGSRMLVYRDLSWSELAGWETVEGHSKGCELLYNLICTDCEVKLKGGAPSQYHPNGSKAAGAAGVGGTVEVNFSEKWHRWEKEAGANGETQWRKKPAVVPSKARVLAHELGHAVRGCTGKYIYPNNKDFENFEGLGYSSYGGTRISVYYNQKTGERFRSHKAIAKSIWGNREEYETTNDWENPIAQELGETPRLGHQ
jgi:RHS repeat-associated protein